MANFKFEGVIEDLSDEQKTFVTKVLEENGFDGGSIQVSLVGKAGDNYVANVKRFIIENNGKTLKMIAKVASKNPLERMMMNANILFGNEHVIYTEVLPKFSELEKEVGIPEQDRLRYAKCYGSLTKEPNEIILLEDLNEKGLVMLDKFSSLSNETVKLILNNFAALHSLSYAMKDREPMTYETLINKLISLWTVIAGEPVAEEFFGQIENSVLMLADNERYKELVKNTVSKFPENAKANSKIDRHSKFAVIQQGDCWTNNLMFKLEDEKPTDCYMIDYQMSIASSPMADFQYMVLACTNYETRAKHYYEWIDYYHKKLYERLSFFGLDIEQIYPRDQLEADLKTLAKTSLGNGLMLSAIQMKSDNESQEFKDAIQNQNCNNNVDIADIVQVGNMGKETIGRVKEKIDGIIKSFIDFGYLQL